MKYKSQLLICLAAAVALPGIALRLAGVQLGPEATAAISGLAILGASFLLLWACDAAQADISQSLALAIVALVAVLPEYSVDMYFTWQAGRDETGKYAHFAIANMTGANRLLIGVAWALIAFITWARFRRAVEIDEDRRTELLFLGLATLYAFIIPLKGTLAWYDTLVFLGLYGWYIVISGRRPHCECEPEGPAEVLARLSKGCRRCATAALFLFAAGAILANAKPFCEGLIGTGRSLGISEFLLVQWLAPIASEAPEFIVALGFAWRAQAGTALGSLLSAKLNQWTLLVGMIPAVYALAHQTLGHPMPMDHSQMHEILLTASQSLLAVVLLASMRFTINGGLLLFGLFAAQLVSPGIVDALPGGPPFGLTPQQIHPVFSLLYLASALTLFAQHPQMIFALKAGLQASPCEDDLPRPAAGGAETDDPRRDFRTPGCRSCRWRKKTIAEYEAKHAELAAEHSPEGIGAGVN
jgi:cation:H+ antiporter